MASITIYGKDVKNPRKHKKYQVMVKKFGLYPYMESSFGTKAARDKRARVLTKQYTPKKKITKKSKNPNTLKAKGIVRGTARWHGASVSVYWHKGTAYTKKELALKAARRKK